MPSTHLTRGLVNYAKLCQWFDKLLTLLEKMSDETFWNTLLGERVLNLLKRYFGSDVVCLGFIVYLAPIVRCQVYQLFYWVIGKFNESLYVSIQIDSNEHGYDAILEYVASRTTQIRDLRCVEGRCIYKDDWEDEEDEWDTKNVSKPPRLTLYPLEETQNELVYKGHKVWVKKKKNGISSDSHYSNDLKDLLGAMNSKTCIEVSMRGQNLNLLKSFVQEWINEHFAKQTGELYIYKCLPSRYDGFEWSNIGSKELRSFESVILKQGRKERILKDIQTFRRREHWYTCRGIPYRRGYLLYGPPGTGKTSFVQSVASKINMNVAIISLSGSMDDEKFNVMLQDVPHNSILIMEDIDHCIIKDPSSGTDSTSSKITMSGLLNALDGVAAQEGAMVFLTCNDINRLQPALLRPGRIDMKMELGYADKDQIRKMFWRFLWDGSLNGEEDVKPKVLETLADQFTEMIPDLTVTPAELQNFFILNIMDKHNEDFEEDDSKRDYSYLLEAIPAFLETVERDRKQALKHKKYTKGNNEEEEKDE